MYGSIGFHRVSGVLAYGGLKELEQNRGPFKHSITDYGFIGG